VTKICIRNRFFLLLCYCCSVIKWYIIYKHQARCFRTTPVTPTTTTIEISTPCEVSFLVSGPVRFLVSYLTMASSTTIPLLRFRFLWLEYIPRGIIFPILSACSSELISIFLRTADFRTLHYDG